MSFGKLQGSCLGVVLSKPYLIYVHYVHVKPGEGKKLHTMIMANIASVKKELKMENLQFSQSAMKGDDKKVIIDPETSEAEMSNWVNFDKRATIQVNGIPTSVRVIAHIEVALDANGEVKGSTLATSDRLFSKECKDEDTEEVFITICEMGEHTKVFSLD